MDDLALLHRFSRQGSEAAFATIVGRYVNLVHSAALRQVRSPDLASDVTQRVFLELSASVAKLRPNTHLAAWLHVVTRRVAIDTVRRESSRQRREQAAAEVAAMKTDSPLWEEVSAQLDEALATLDAVDRTAILMRFFENRSLGEIGDELGASENAAQKRISRALERLRTALKKRGIATTAAGLSAEISLHGMESVVPAALAGEITAGLQTSLVALPSAAFSTAAHVTASFTSKAIVVAGIVITAAGLLYQTYLVRDRQVQIGILAAAITELDRQIARDGTERNRNAVPRGQPTAIATLAADPELDPRLQALLTRVVRLKQHLEAHQEQKIPEIDYLGREAWIRTAQQFPHLETDADFAAAGTELRSWAINAFGPRLSKALKSFIKANDGRLPTEVTQLAPYFTRPIDPAVLLRYEVRAAGLAKDFDEETTIIAEKTSAVVNPDKDSATYITTEFMAVGRVEREKKNARQDLSPEAQEFMRELDAARDAYTAAHNGRSPTNGEQLRPFIKNHEIAASDDLSGITMSVTYSDPLDILDPRALSNPRAVENATKLFRADHHGAHPTSPEELALYFQDPTDAAKYILALIERDPGSSFSRPSP